MSVDVPAALTASYDKWAEIASEIDDVDPQKSREMMQQAASMGGMGGMGGMMGMGAMGGMPGMPPQEPPPAPAPLVDEPEFALDRATFAEMTDVSAERNRTSLKTTLKRGDGSGRPVAGSIVRVHFVGRKLSGAVFDSSWDQARAKMEKAGSQQPQLVTAADGASVSEQPDQTDDKSNDAEEDYELELEVLRGRLSHLKRSELSRRAMRAGASEDDVDDAYDADDPTQALCDLVARLELPVPPPVVVVEPKPPCPQSGTAFDWDGPLAIEATDQFVSFKLFQNKAFPPGMHEALATMEPGERARLVLKSKKAYGGEDSPMVPIKLDAIKEPLQFEVVLLWFSDRDDVAGSGGSAERAITTTGTGPQRPKRGDECSIVLEARLESTNEPLFLCGNNSERDEKGTDRVDAEINAEDAFIYTVGTGGPGGVLPGLDTLLSVMRQNETCSFKLSGEQLALMPFVANSGDEDAAQFEQTQVVLQATPGLAQTPAVENWAQFVAELPAGTAVVGELTLVTIDALTNAIPDGTVRFKEMDGGTGWRKPSDCDELRLTYDLRSTDGDTVLQSGGGAEGEMHILGEDTLPDGLQYVFLKMKAEQQCIVEIKPPHCGDTVEKTLTGTVTLLSFVQITDLSPDGNRGLLLRDIDRGPDPVAFKSPKAFSELLLHLTISVVASSDGGEEAQQGEPEPLWSTRRPLGNGLPLEVTLDDEELPFPGIETAVRKGLDGKGMKEGAKALLTATPEFCGVAAREYNIPDGATVEVRIELLSFENIPETWDMNADKRLETANFFKEKGNAAFKTSKFEKALEFYTQGKRLATSENYQKLTDEQTSKQTGIVVNCRNNMAQVYLKQKQFKEAREELEEVLQLEPQNAKALYRRGAIHSQHNEFDAAAEDFNAVLVLEPENKAVLKEKALLRKRKAAYKKKSKKEFAGVFERMQEEDHKAWLASPQSHPLYK